MLMSVENLAFRYAGGGRRLEHLNFTVASGEIFCVLGPSGAGKTTLIRCIIGSLPPSSGRVFFEGKAAHRMTSRQFASHVAHVPQSAKSAFGRRVLDTVLMGRRAHFSMFKRPGTRDRDIAEHALGRVGIGHLAGREVSTICSGERQLCLLARAIAQEAPVLVMDEPAASLDVSDEVRILETISGLARDGYAILMATHHPDHALLVGTKVMALRRGSVFGIGKPDQLLTSAMLSALFDAPMRAIEEHGGVRARFTAPAQGSNQSGLAPT